MPNEEIPKHLFEADAFVSPSLYESWGLVVNEAMAAGLPVILSDKFNAAFTLLKDGENGYMFDPYQEYVLTKHLLNFINLSDEDKKQMSQRSLEIIGEMDFDYMGSQLISAIEHIKTTRYKKPSIIASLIIGNWFGRYNTIEWDKV